MSDQDWAEVKTKQQKRETKTKPKEEEKKQQKDTKKNKDEIQKQKLKQPQEKNQSKKQKNEESDEEEQGANYLASTIYSQAEKILEEKQKVKFNSRWVRKKSWKKISKHNGTNSDYIGIISQRREEASGVALPVKKKKSAGSGARSQVTQILPIKSKVSQ